MKMRMAASSLIGLSLLAGAVAAQPSRTSAPTLEAQRSAVAVLPAGRFARPSSYNSMTDEQKSYLASLLSGPRNAVSGPLVVMLASPTLGDLAQRTMAFARFAGEEGYSSVPPKLNELAVIMAARMWSSPYVWNAH